MSREELNFILDHSLSWACESLEKDAFFYPFSFVLKQDGSLHRSGELTEQEKGEDPEVILRQMHAMLAAGCRQKMYKAVAVGVDVKVQRFVSEGFVKAAEVIIEHEDGFAVDCFLPYRQTASGTYEYGTIFSSAIEAEKFVGN